MPVLPTISAGGAGLPEAGGATAVPGLNKRCLMRRARRKSIAIDDVEVEMTPLIDCVFLLLIFFLVTTMLKKLEKQIPVLLPDATASLATAADREYTVIGIGAAGKYFRSSGITDEGNVMYSEIPDLAAYLKKVAETDGTTRALRLDADREVEFQAVVDALDICALQGFENVGVRLRESEKLYYELQRP